MKISSISAFQPMKSSKPSEPTPPPGGNIENRQPPSEPTGPSGVQKNPDLSVQSVSNSKAANPEKLIDVCA